MVWDWGKLHLNHNKTTLALNRLCVHPQQSLNWAQIAKHVMFVGQIILPDHVSEGSQMRCNALAVFGFWVSGQVVCPPPITIVTWGTINTLTPSLPHPPFLYLFLFCCILVCLIRTFTLHLQYHLCLKKTKHRRTFDIEECQFCSLKTWNIISMLQPWIPSGIFNISL